MTAKEKYHSDPEYRAKVLRYNRAHFAKNRKRYLVRKRVRAREYYAQNSFKWKERFEKNRDSILLSRGELLRRCPNARIRKSLSRRISETLILHGLRAKVRSKKVELLVGGIENARLRLEALFRSNMGWKNYGEMWHIDHVTPLSWFDLRCPVQRRYAFHFSNLQPLLVEENLRKGCSYSG